MYRIDRKRRIYYYVYFKSKLNYNLLQQEKRKQNGGENADDRFKRKKNHLLNRNIFKFIVISMKYMTKIAKK